MLMDLHTYLKHYKKLVALQNLPVQTLIHNLAFNNYDWYEYTIGYC